MFEMLLRILLLERGTVSEGRTIDEDATPKEGDQANKDQNAGDNQDPPPEGQGDEAASDVEGEGEGEGEDQGQGDNPPGDQEPEPQFGEYGDDAGKVYEALLNLKGKTAATEGNMAALNKALEASGIKAVKGENGYSFQTINKEPQPRQRERRFNDDHRKLFEEDHVNGITALIQDVIEDILEDRSKQDFERQKQVNAWISVKKESNALMDEMYPQLVPDLDANGKPQNPNFNEAFYNRATEIWQEKYQNDPRGEFRAAREAASELKIDFRNTQAAVKAGFDKGQQRRKVVGPVGGNSGGEGALPNGKLSRSQYLALDPEKREEYDRKQQGL